MHSKISTALVSLWLFCGGISLFVIRLGRKVMKGSCPKSMGGLCVLTKSTVFRDAVKSLTSSSCTCKKFMVLPHSFPQNLWCFVLKQDGMFVTVFLILQACA